MKNSQHDWCLTNAVPSGHCTGQVKVGPMQAFLNHSCSSNTVSDEDPASHAVLVTASRNIPAGSEITTRRCT